MSISGNLETMAFAELLQWLEQGQKTGTLVIDNGQIEKRVTFEGGTIISSSTSDPNEYLGHFLVSHGYIDEQTLADAMGRQEETRTLLGKILVDMDAISQEDLDRMLELKAEESIYEIFTWSEGDFRFVEEKVPEYNMVPLKLKVTRLVMEGHQRIDEWSEIRKVVPSTMLIPVSVVELTAPEKDPVAKKILAHVDDDRTIAEIALQAHASEFHVCRILHKEVKKRTLKLIRVIRSGGLAGGEERSELESDQLLKSASRHLDEGDLIQALRHLRAATDLDPNSQKVKGAIKNQEERIRERIADFGVLPEVVPVPLADLTELDTHDLSPQEGFVLTRVNGRYDLRTICRITPLPILEAEVAVWQLLQRGHIKLTEQPD